MRLVMPACLAVTFIIGTAMGAGTPAPTDLKQRQMAIQQSLRKIADGMDATTDADHQVKNILYALSANEMLEAVKVLDQLNAVNATDTTPLVRRLEQCQDRSIETIEKILGIVNLMQTQTKAIDKSKAGTDPQPDLVRMLSELNNRLQDFIKEQKKVIEDTASLAKEAADNLNDDKDKKLGELAAVEDKWAKFLSEQYTDLSKMPMQDFSNPSLLEEMVQTYTELEMAKDALQKKSVEVATPLEENGVELAKSIESNIEKWLMDVPDRLQWKMEEPLQDYQVPMADLPKELEDIVGDLMEQEDDLLSDIEDATSAWGDSIDKGVGWDAMDGPISNMTAKGVTGNQLPNTSEIGGRSGEGRSGKSAGEFVGQEAVGKGGRKTPTRLTPDPFEKGVVNDKSQEPPGGSTGGGKASGAGGAGLEGPAPPEANRPVASMAGRQADLRNKAEKVKVMFDVMNYPTAEISGVIRNMKSLEEDMLNRRYQNIARTKQVVLNGMRDTRGFLQGEMSVHQERGLGLPKHMQDEIINAIDEEAPKGYEELLRGYYESLCKTK
jgi:hypothetical protein